MAEMKNIPFSPPDITEAEISEVVDTLRSGWITTGPKTKQFEKEIASYCNTSMAACMNSATAAMELTLRLLGIGPGDEVITSAYTYTASASVILHVGATPVLVDTAKDSYEMDYEKLEQAINIRTKAIIPIDIAGVMCDYDRIFEIVNRNKEKFLAFNPIQEAIGHVIIVADAAHSLGAIYKGRKSGEVADFTCFSFHAVKNLTTAEGGAVTWKAIKGIDDEDIYRQFMLLSLHGQSKDALNKSQKGAWEYDIVIPGYKANMTDIMAAMGLAQMRRYDDILKHRKHLISLYDEAFKNKDLQILKHYGDDYSSSGHLYLVRLIGRDSEFRNQVIIRMAEKGIAANVHYKPLPMHSAYKNLGFDIKNYPNAYNQYANEITLPLHGLMNDEDAILVSRSLINSIGELTEVD